MEMIQTEKLVYEYEKRDEEGNVQFSDTMVPVNQRLRSI